MSWVQHMGPLVWVMGADQLQVACSEKAVNLQPVPCKIGVVRGADVLLVLELQDWSAGSKEAGEEEQLRWGA